MDPTYALRSATGQYRTTPLRGLWQHPPYFHDGSASDLLAVVNHYDRLCALNLSESQKSDLVEFLKSLWSSPGSFAPRNPLHALSRAGRRAPFAFTRFARSLL